MGAERVLDNPELLPFLGRAITHHSHGVVVPRCRARPAVDGASSVRHEEARVEGHNHGDRLLGHRHHQGELGRVVSAPEARDPRVGIF